MKEKINRLEKLLTEIEMYSKYEENFDAIYDLLLNEHMLEGGGSKGRYENNLRQTIQKQARTYQDSKQKKSKKGAPSEFRDFIYHFKLDITTEISLLKTQNKRKTK